MSTRKTDSQSQRSSKRALAPAEVAAVTDAEIDFSDIPELDETFWREAKLVMPDRTEQLQKPRATKAESNKRVESIGLWSDSCAERLIAAKAAVRTSMARPPSMLPVKAWHHRRREWREGGACLGLRRPCRRPSRVGWRW